MKKRMRAIMAIGIMTTMLFGQTLQASAAPADEIASIQNQQASTSAELASLQASITDLESQKAALTSQIDGFQAQLVTTIASIQSLDNSISQKTADLEQTEKDLAAAREDQATQYEAMKKRIQYVYENGGSTGWAGVVLGETSLSNTLNSVEDTNKLYQYDRDELNNYTEATERVTALEEQQVNEKSQLETMKTEQESGKATLESMISEAQLQSDDFDVQLASAEAIASQYQALIAEQNAQIAELAAQQAAIEAEAAAQAEAQRQQEAEQAAQETAVADAVNSSEVESSISSEPTADTSDTQMSAVTESSNSSTTSTSSNSSPASTPEAETPTATTSYDSASGQAVVNYAMQFIGNPYVWGGTSLTNGADCSGFVMSVYAHFGVSLSRTTYTQMYDGVGVSYAEAQPGDIIVYDGHVGIYMGGGRIVHAANEAQGITTGNATYTSILAVRRIFT